MAQSIEASAIDEADFPFRPNAWRLSIDALVYGPSGVVEDEVGTLRYSISSRSPTENARTSISAQCPRLSPVA